MKHLRALEVSGIIRTTKSGRVRTCTLEQARLAVIDAWIAEQRALWEARAHRLEAPVTDHTGPDAKEDSA